MNKVCLLVIASGLIAATAAQAQGTGQQDLPSAPSATLQQQMKQHEPPPAQRTKPEATSPAPSPSAPTIPAPAAGQQEAASVTEKNLPHDAKNEAPGGGTGSAEPANETADQGDLPTIISIVNEVNVVFTVTDKHGKFIKDLKQSDFKVLDNNQPAQQVRGFHAETDLPLRVGLLVDASNSIRDRFTFEQEAAIEFLNQIIRPKSDRAFVIGFDTTAEVTQDFTDDSEKLSRGVRSLRAGGGTALYDAIYYACRDKLMKEKGNAPARRAIILLTDGEDNQSRVTREEAIEMAQRAEVIIYGISTNVSGVKLHGDKILERMAEATGGRAFFPFKVQDVANAFSEIQDELRSQYQLAYKPADLQPDGRYHSIDILADNRKNLKVRARKGYFAPKP